MKNVFYLDATRDSAETNKEYLPLKSVNYGFVCIDSYL